MLCLALLCVQTANAVQAYPWPVTITQPDGTVVTLQGHGDEWYNWVTTDDGYTVLRDEAGCWTYAQLVDDQLISSGRVARDQRSHDDLEFLATVAPGLQPQAIPARQWRVAGRNRLLGWEPIDMNKFRGLIVLVNYSDRQFILPDMQAHVDAMVNRLGYTGYTDPTTHEFVECTGSVRDYFTENTMGLFSPEFDVVGPVNVDYTQTYVNKSEYSRELFSAALQALEGQVDFSRYDANGDSVVDMVYFIVAGYGSNNPGANPSLLWPHAWEFNNFAIGSTRFARYACSTEFQGLETAAELDGIGTICHEFTHVMTLPDLYDTDYDSSNGYSNHPFQWSVLASGNYLNNSRTPAGYGAYERYALGCLRPQVITATGNYRLDNLQTTNQALRIDTSVDHEYFLLENRQPVRWDAYLPGHGMLVWRVDSTDVTVWERNRVNCNPMHNYYELVRACNTPYATDDDPFPGTMGVDSLVSRAESPTLQSWAHVDTPMAIRGIVENDGIITFHVDAETVVTLVETFEQMPVTAADTVLQGSYAQWQLIGGRIVCPDTVWCNGERAVSLARNEVLQTATPVTGPLARITLRVSNPNAFALQMQAAVSTDDGLSWTVLSEFTHGTTAQIASRTTMNLRYEIDRLDHVLFRFQTTSGLSSRSLYLDDVAIAIYQAAAHSHDVTGDGKVDIADVNAVINVMLGKAFTSGELQAASDVTGDGVVDIADVNAVINAMLGK